MSKKKDPSNLDKAIDEAEKNLTVYEPEDKEYQAALAALEKLHAIRTIHTNKSIDPRVTSALVTAGASLLGLVAMIVFELNGNVFSFRSALSRLPKP